MWQISRRSVLSLVPAAGVLAIARPPLPAVAAAETDFARLLANTVAIFGGTAESNARPELAGKLAAVGRTARNRLAGLDSAGDGELFAGLPLGTSDINLTRSYQYLYEIALATRTAGAGSDLVDNVAVQRRVIDALVWLHENYYGDQDAGYYGNWYNWEIGISTHVSRSLALLAGQLAEYRPELTATYVASMDAYLRNGKNGDVDLDSRFHTGANLADITTNRIVQGALLGGDGGAARISKAVADQSTVFATIDPYNLRHGVTDGYYADGSFIQHHSVAYTGSYGKTLLNRVAQRIKILDGTSYAGGGDLLDVVRGWVVDGFAPLIFEGWMMEIVKGRAVSRTRTGYADVVAVIESIVDLTDYLRVADALALKGYVRYLAAKSPESLDPTGFVSPVSAVRYLDILADDGIPPGDLNPARRSVAFNAMDRAVHRRPGYAFALARGSERISKYEYMNGENLMPWFQGDGAYYLYLSGQDQGRAFGVDYYTTVSPYRLAGVTSPVEQRQTIPELYGELWYENPDHPLNFTSSSESQNTYVYFPRGTNAFSGGATLGEYGVAGMVQSDDVPYVHKQAGILPDDFVAYANARSMKSWFMLDDEIVVLVAGISDPAGRAVVTAIDSRVALPSDDVEITREPGRWLRYANRTERTAVGYVFLDGREPEVTLEEVTRSRRVVRLSNPDTEVTRKVFGLAVEQPTGAEEGTVAYALVPNATESRLRGYAAGPLTVLANNRRVQAIKHTGLNLIAATVFAEGWRPAERLAIDGPASVLARWRDGVLAVAVSDPTMNRRRVSLLVRGKPLTLISADDGVTARRAPGGTLITADTTEAYGRSFTATLRAR